MTSDKDKRVFRRYKLKPSIELSSEESEVKARITAYSLKGIGFVIDATRAVTSGSNIHFKIEELALEDAGRIVWIICRGRGAVQ